MKTIQTYLYTRRQLELVLHGWKQDGAAGCDAKLPRKRDPAMRVDFPAGSVGTHAVITKYRYNSTYNKPVWCIALNQDWFMRQSEATPARPFYSVGYQYARNPWTMYSCNEFWRVLDGKKGTDQTMPGTDNEATAKRLAEWCVTQPGIQFAWVHVTTDCYNHKEVCKVERK